MYKLIKRRISIFFWKKRLTFSSLLAIIFLYMKESPMKTGCTLIITFLLILSSAGLCWSQTEGGVVDTGISDYLRSGSDGYLGVQTFGLLDPSRMTMSHSYSMSYLSSGGQGLAQGLFMETIGYRLSNPLTLILNLGYLHQPYSSFNQGDAWSGSGSFVGGAALTWKPAENMFLHFEVANYGRPSNYGYYPWWVTSPNANSPVTPVEQTQGFVTEVKTE
ncbi:hypothetical protein CEE37_11130 [candidate division LCP-89 bacterium B3_LCP]|uniref:Uncharacterized protein n=1 Tax=candidate division LCP-89 bacterium B3_LCP TaxID=2012998 RepID=A0A532UY44_UNCL8|nr:MAG: hypothetical protein CEE37_11130 [candidate division LCP-89 bacterium B3_LCP]